MGSSPARAANIQAIVDYFESGVKASAEKVGLELEHTLVHSSGRPVSYADAGGQRDILEELAEDYTDVTRDAKGNISMLSDGTSDITIEPAAQMEVSAGPFADLNDALACLRTFEERVESAAGADVDVMTIGYHPTMKAIDLELIPKVRYQIMNEYLGGISMYGICMMRGSAATQVAIDYTSVDDCLRKLRLANALVPVLSLVADNSPVFEAAPRPHQLVRTEIWNKCDPARCGTVPGVMDPGFTLEDYAAYILDTPAMVDISTGEPRISDKTFNEIYANSPMTEADVEHALSVFFTDVRLKRYIEVRPADALPAEHAVAYAALLKGLFYSDENLDQLDRIFANVSANDIAQAKLDLMESGYGAQIYGHAAGALADQVISLAAAGLSESERALLKPLAELVASRVTLADMTIQEANE